MKKIAVLILMMLLIAGSVYAEPSTPIAEAMTTPANVFDLYLYTLENECNKTFFIGKDNSSISVSYDFEDNLININFYFDPSVETYKNALGKDDKEKIENLFRLSADFYALRLGLTEYKIAGILYNIPVRRGYQTKGFDENIFKEEIIKRTVLRLNLQGEEKWYTLKRDHHGAVLFTVKDLSKPTKKTK